MMPEVTACGRSFRTAEDYRDHLPCQMCEPSKTMATACSHMLGMSSNTVCDHPSHCACKQLGCGGGPGAITYPPLSIKAVQEVADDQEWLRRIISEAGGSQLTGDPDFDEVLRECVEIMATKGSDYMAGTADRLHNFRQAAEELGISMREVVYVYMWKHLASIRTYCRTGEVKSEGLRSHITDVINYLLLLYKVEQDVRRQQLHTEG